MGRLAPEKGPGLFLAVANELASLMPSARFVIVGDGTLRHAVESLADELGIARWAFLFSDVRKYPNAFRLSCT